MNKKIIDSVYINGKEVTNKRKAVLNIVKEYVKNHPNISYRKLKEVFPDNLQPSTKMGVLKNKKDLGEWENSRSDHRPRFFKEPIKINGDEIYVCNQWGDSNGRGSFTRFIEHVVDKKLHPSVKVIYKDDNNLIDKSIDIKKENKNMVKNIILYGAPGVGKTHNVNKLIKLIEDGKSDKEIFDAIKVNENSDRVDISDIEERVRFVTFHQSFGYEDFIEGFRPNEDEKIIKLESGIFKKICLNAQKNLEDSEKTTSEIEQNLDLLSIFKNYVNYKIEEIEPIKLKKGGEFYLIKFEDDKLYFSTSEDSNYFQSFTLSFDDFLKIYNSDINKNTLQDISDILGTNSIQQKYAYILAIYKDFMEHKDKFNIDYNSNNSKVEKQNYYLVIDEINRGNISKIFGELITLIEEDKRDKLEVILPYSKKPFKVPSNLYIIGTMNSTDKSIALIDIALRRRFTFVKMEPKANLIEDEDAREVFVKLNEKIKDDLGKDYQLGHSYFINIKNRNDLNFVLEYKIISLLEEYYYGDDRLSEVLKLCEDIIEVE